MTDSDDKTKRIVDKALLEDSHCRMHRGLTDRNWAVLRIAILVVAAAIGGVATLTVKAVVDVRGQRERNKGQDKLIVAVDKRVDDFKSLLIGMQEANAEMVGAMQETNTEIARSVGRMEGMWAAQLKQD